MNIEKEKKLMKCEKLNRKVPKERKKGLNYIKGQGQVLSASSSSGSGSHRRVRSSSLSGQRRSTAAIAYIKARGQYRLALSI